MENLRSNILIIQCFKNKCRFFVDDAEIILKNKTTKIELEEGIHNVKYVIYHRVSIFKLIFYVLLCCIDMFATSGFDDLGFLLSKVENKTLECTLNIHKDMILEIYDSRIDYIHNGIKNTNFLNVNTNIDFKWAKVLIVVLFFPLVFIVGTAFVALVGFSVNMFCKGYYQLAVLFSILSVIVFMICCYVVKKSPLFIEAIDILKQHQSGDGVNDG